MRCSVESGKVTEVEDGGLVNRGNLLNGPGLDDRAFQELFLLFFELGFKGH